MKRPFFSALFAFALLACNSASSGRGDLSPTQLNPDDPSGPSLPPAPRASPPPSTSGSPGAETPAGCPDKRAAGSTETSTDLTSVADVRARLVGMYRDCHGSFGTELRLDPDSDTRLLMWSLDDRFVRRTTPGTSGWIDIQSCDGSACTVAWHIDDAGSDTVGPVRELTMWSDPIAVHIEVDIDNTLSYFEWVRVAK